ncbi:hypothetical protein HY991_05295 [Candidatus Micrarchaeota archaeon]|nr:hypothetical protein [Candidatus Micrarchaeota archaeon]
MEALIKSLHGFKRDLERVHLDEITRRPAIYAPPIVKAGLLVKPLAPEESKELLRHLAHLEKSIEAAKKILQKV